jgi:hypothetical protein
MTAHNAASLNALAFVARFVSFFCLTVFICSPDKGFGGIACGVLILTAFWQIANACERYASK